MKKILLLLLVANFSLQIFAQENPTFKAYWSNGMKIERSDGAFKLKFGGRLQNDWAAFFEDNGIKDSIGTSKNGIEFRRVRLFSSGTIYHNIQYKVQLDFAGGKAKLRDAYIKIVKIPVVGFVQIGHFKEPVGFEELTSSKYLTFMERSLTSSDEPARNTGIMIGNSIGSDRLNFRLGIFKDTDDFGNAIGLQDKYNVTARLFGTPLYNKERNRILHLGTSYSYRSPQMNEYELAVRPEAHLSNKYLTTGLISNASNFQLIQAEAAFITGPFSLRSELVHARLKRENPVSEDFNYTVFYVMGSYFLTGESKSYHSDGIYSRVKPKKNFDGKGGAGAWELGLRFSSMDINKVDVAGGNLGNITFALNWYLNPATRIMTNYIYADLKGVGYANIVQMRFQVDF